MPRSINLFLVSLLLASLCSAATNAAAEAIPAETPPLTWSEDEGEPEPSAEEEEEEREEERELCESGEAEPDECEAETDPAATPAAGACVLRSAGARVVVSRPRAHARLRLMVRYRSSEPTRSLGVLLRGGRGTLTLRLARRRLGRTGVLRIRQRLNGAQAEKARASQRVIVRLTPSHSPGRCRPLRLHRLARHRTGGSRRRR